MDVIKSMKAYVRISQVFGLFPYEMNVSNGCYFLTESPSLLKYSKILFYLLAFSEGSTIVSSNFSFDYTNELSTKFVLWVSMVTLYVSFLIIFRTVSKKQAVLCYWLNRFNNLCLTCTAKCNPGKVEKFNRRLLFFTTFYFFLVLVTKYVTYEKFSFSNIFADFIFFTRLWIIHLFLKHFVIFANFVRCFYVVMGKNLSIERASAVSKSWVKVLRELRSKDLFVKDFVAILHSIYMPVLLVQLMWFFATLLCDITTTRSAGMPTMMQVDWMVYILSETVLYVTVCHLTGKEAEKSICCLQEQLLNLNDPEVLFEVELYSLQIQHTKLNFNVLGFFKLDCTLLYSMIGATTTYTVILLQFQSDYMTKIQGIPSNTSLIVEELLRLKQNLNTTVSS